MREFAVVDGDVGLAARAVACQRGAGHLAHDALCDLPHAREIGGSHLGVLLVELAQQARLARSRQRHRAVLRHDGVHRPVQCEWFAPAHRPARDGNHVHAGRAQFIQRPQYVGGDLALGRQGVVDVGEDAADAAPRCGRPTCKWLHASLAVLILAWD